MKSLIFVSLFVLFLQFGAFAQNKEFESGMKAARVKDFQTALEHFQNSKDPNLSDQKLAQVHYNIGVCYYQLKYVANASAEFEAAVKLNPNYEKAFYALGMAQVDLQNWNRAEAVFQQLLKLSNGRNGEAWFDLAFVYVEQKKYDEAFTSFEKASSFGSRSAGAIHNNLGVLYALKGNLERASAEIETAKELGYGEAGKNLAFLRKIMLERDQTLIASLILR
jgi:Flp pilus assembly protein TadD